MNDKQTEALKLALEALERTGNIKGPAHDREQDAITAIREALVEQPDYRAVKTWHEGKPVYVAEQQAQQEPICDDDVCTDCGMEHCECGEKND